MRPFTNKTLITEFDQRRLKGLLSGVRKRSGVDAWRLTALELELERAEVVSPLEVPSGVVTMNSRVRLLDLDTGERTYVALVFPDATSTGPGTDVPVLSPLGLALLGARAGEVMEWPLPTGQRRLRVEDIVYQPEAAGHFFS